MKTVEIHVGTKYNVYIGKDLLRRAGEMTKAVYPKAETAAIISDDRVFALYGAAVEKSLAEAGLCSVKLILPHGEESKNGENFLRILEFLAENRLSRGDIVAALGGGMVGDIAGFAASAYMRGIGCVQIPTTLLSAVDSSVGGKTAIDLKAGKNLAGAFFQPGLVLCDYHTLATLPENTFADGCAEVVKYAVLFDPELFAHLEARGRDFDMEYVISRCVSLKRDVVETDERDTGERRRLNLGHTLGHAIEAESAYAVSHGSAVAVGLACVSRAACAKGMLDAESAERICALLDELGLPTETGYDIDALCPHMLMDKKRVGASVNVIIPEKIGSARIIAMSGDKLKEFMKAGL